MLWMALISIQSIFYILNLTAVNLLVRFFYQGYTIENDIRSFIMY